MSELVDALDAIDRAVHLAGDAVPAGITSAATDVVTAARRRNGYLGDTVVVALGGGTGAGKSSILNAIAGDEVADVGAIRPTTSEPLAWIPSNPEPGLVRLLDDLGITRRVGHRGNPHLAVVDLPDFDSIETAHRATVERLLPRLDAVLWVLDPQKYADRRLHAEFLAPLAGYRDQFRFVLNQTDRLPRHEVDEVAADLARLLEADGMGRPDIIRTAVPRSGRREGIEALTAHLEVTLEAKRTVLAKLAQDVRVVAAALGNAVGVGTDLPASGDAWEQIAAEVTAELLAHLAGDDATTAAVRGGRRMALRRGSGPLGRVFGAVRRSLVGKALGAHPEDGGLATHVAAMPRSAAVDGAAGRLRRYVVRVAAELGDAFGAELRRDLPAAELDDRVAAAVGSAIDAVRPADRAPARWWSLAGALQFLLFAGLVAGVVWLWADPSPFRRGEWPWAAILAGVSAFASFLLYRLVVASGTRRGRRAAESYRESLRVEIGRRLAASVRTPIAILTDRRRALWSALTDAATAADRVTASVR